MNERQRLEVPAHMPLNKYLERISATARCVRVHKGYPVGYYGPRYAKKLHARIRYKKGEETFRSKSLGQAALEGTVAKAFRTKAGQGRYDYDLYVFIPFGRDRRFQPACPNNETLPFN